MNRLTASRLDLAAECPGSHSLAWTRDTSEAAKNGTDRHAFVQRAADGDRSGALELLPAAIRDRMEKVDLDALFALFPTHPRAEVPVAYDPVADTAREIPQSNGHRDYSSVKPHEIPGTIDLLGVGADVVTVGDLKTGASWVPHPRESRQVQFAAVSSARLFGKSRARGFMLKVEEDGAVRPLFAEWDEMDLDAISVELRRVKERVEAATTADLVVGTHCRWCPARTRCPEIVDRGQALVAIGKRASELSNDALVRAWQAWKAIKPIGELIEEEARGRVTEGGPIQTTPGKVLRLVETKRESLILGAAIESANGDRNLVARILAAGSLTEAGIRRHMSPEEADSLLDAIRERNGVRLNHSQSLRETKEKS